MNEMEKQVRIISGVVLALLIGYAAGIISLTNRIENNPKIMIKALCKRAGVNCEVTP